MSANVIAIVNQKGGVGKTTTSINIAAALSQLKKRVLLIDLDPQGNATMGSGVDKNSLSHTIYDLLVDGAKLSEQIIKNTPAGYDLLPANADLTAAEVELINETMREYRLRQGLTEALGDYDYIFIDCPPSLNMLTINALTAASAVMIPMQCEYYALEGLTALLNTIEQIRTMVNPKLHIQGILRTMYDPRNSLTNQVSEQLFTHFGDCVYQTTIPRNVRLAEAPSHGISALQYDPQSRGAIAYLSLAKEILGEKTEQMTVSETV